MDIVKLKAAVEQLQEMLLDIQTEVNEYQCNKSDWYYNQLLQHESGLFTKEEFQPIFKKCVDMSNSFDVSFSLQGLENIVTGYENFLKKNEELLDLIAKAENRVPKDWKLYKVMYREGYNEIFGPHYIYAPNAEKAKERVEDLYVYAKYLQISEVTEEKE